MHVIPVIDLLKGVVVRAVAGRRDEYRPVESVLTESVQPLDVARSLRRHVGHGRLYVADLDAILHRQPNWEIYRQLDDDGFSTMIDAGLTSVSEALHLQSAISGEIIIGLESWPGPQELSELCTQVDVQRLWFSLDLKSGKPLAGPNWMEKTPFDIAETAIEGGIRQMIVLDLAQVGTGTGVDTLDLCWELRRRWPDIKLITGGGIRTAADLPALQQIGLDGALVASALHDGRI